MHLLASHTAPFLAGWLLTKSVSSPASSSSIEAAVAALRSLSKLA